MRLLRGAHPQSAHGRPQRPDPPLLEVGEGDRVGRHSVRTSVSPADRKRPSTPASSAYTSGMVVGPGPGVGSACSSKMSSIDCQSTATAGTSRRRRGRRARAARPTGGAPAPGRAGRRAPARPPPGRRTPRRAAGPWHRRPPRAPAAGGGSPPTGGRPSRGDVDRVHPPLRTDRLGHRHGDRAAAGPHVEGPLARPRSQQVHQPARDGAEERHAGLVVAGRDPVEHRRGPRHRVLRRLCHPRSNAPTCRSSRPVAAGVPRNDGRAGLG